jgi:hypothetical protein
LVHRLNFETGPHEGVSNLGGWGRGTTLGQRDVIAQP